MTLKTESKNIDLRLQKSRGTSSASGTPLSKKRNYGIDFLRLFSMFYVVLLHSLRHCGITNATTEGSAEYIACWFMQICAYGAVNIFALISGYVGYSEKERPLKYSSWFNLWFQVVFYGAVIGLILNEINTEWITADSYIRVFFPVTNYMYWYFTAYTGLFFITPFINAGIRGSSKKNLKILFVSVLVMFSLVEIVFNGQKFNNGYSFAWLFILYILGAIIKKCEIGKNIKVPVAFAGILILNVLCLLWKVYGTDVRIFTYTIKQGTFITYVSPFILGGAILHLIAFSKISFGRRFNKIIAFAAPCSFAVYLINTQFHLWNNVMKDLLVSFAQDSWYIIVIKTVAFALCFVVLAILIDRVRMVLFKALHIHKISEFLEKTINKITGKLIKDS